MIDTISYICNGCRYRFKRKTNWNDSVCPYCGAEDIEKEDTINKLIRDSL